jgi:hypothetical protein
MPEVECILEHQDAIGESPLWSLGEGALYWVDVTAPCIYRLVLATPDELAAQPLNGSLFAVHGTGSSGIPEGEYGR